MKRVVQHVNDVMHSTGLTGFMVRSHLEYFINQISPHWSFEVSLPKSKVNCDLY